MYTNILLASTIGLASLATAVPFKFPSSGFPKVANPSTELTQIELAAHGSLPNGSPPPKISDRTVTSLRLIAFNELAEVAFFTELLNNITTNVFEVTGDVHKDTVVDALTAVLAQEKLHLLNANGALAHFGHDQIQPCEYNFPVTSFTEAIATASTFTDVVLGTLGDVVTLFGTDGDAPLIRGVASVIGQEGEQNGFYRDILKHIPSELPFLTASAREFAFSALNQGFVVPGSCPNIHDIDLPIFDALTIETAAEDIKPQEQKLKFSIAIPNKHVPRDWAAKYGSKYEKLSIVYINQQNKPVYEKPDDIWVYDDKVVFEALFPFDGTTFGNGLTIAVLATGSGATSVDEVAAATAFGPGLIEIN